MVGHQRPCKAFGAGLDKELRKALEKSSPVVIVAEDIAAFHTADDNVLQKLRYI